jgi:hypothetical protein
MFKNAKVVMLPTKEKASIGSIMIQNGKLSLSTKVFQDALNRRVESNPNSNSNVKNMNLYIITDDEIKESEFGVNLSSGSLFKVLKVRNEGYDVEWITGGNIGNNIEFNSIAEPKKIIATTNTSLNEESRFNGKAWENLLPQPSKSFINKFIEEYNKGNIITDILVEYNDIYSDLFELKVNPKDNTITIKKIKNSWNRKEVHNLMMQSWINGESFVNQHYTIRETWIEKTLNEQL